MDPKDLTAPWHAGGQEFEPSWLYPNYTKGFQAFLKLFFNAHGHFVVKEIEQNIQAAKHPPAG